MYENLMVAALFRLPWEDYRLGQNLYATTLVEYHITLRVTLLEKEIRPRSPVS